MHHNFKKLIFFSSLLLLFNKASPLENNYPPTFKTKNKPYLNISALIWQSKEGNLEYAAKNKKFNTEANTSKQKEGIVIPDFGWRPGFKLDLGYFFSYDRWDAKANWTFYRGEFTHVKKHPNVELTPEDNGIIPYYYYNFFNEKTTPSPRYEHATGDWCVYFNSVDVELAKNFKISKKLSTRLLASIKGCSIKQDYKIYYADGNTLESTQKTATLLKSLVKFHNNSFGIGPRLGLETKYHITNWFKIIANNSFSVLMTRFKITRNQIDEIYNEIDLENESLTILLKERYYTMKPNLQLVFGFDFSKSFSKIFLGLSIAYEMQYFFGQNQIRRFLDNNSSQNYSNRGDLQLQGLTATLEFKF